MLFGNEADDSNDAPLVLPQNWGNEHGAYVASWINPSKMTHQIRVELEMHQNVQVEEQEDGIQEQGANAEQENDEDDGNAEVAGRRSARRR